MVSFSPGLCHRLPADYMDFSQIFQGNTHHPELKASSSQACLSFPLAPSLFLTAMSLLLGLEGSCSPQPVCLVNSFSSFRPELSPESLRGSALSLPSSEARFHFCMFSQQCHKHLTCGPTWKREPQDDPHGETVCRMSVLDSSKTSVSGFPGGAVVENPPANARDTGSSPGLGRSHMPRSN